MYFSLTVICEQFSTVFVFSPKYILVVLIFYTRLVLCNSVLGFRVFTGSNEVTKQSHGKYEHYHFEFWVLDVSDFLRSDKVLEIERHDAIIGIT